MEKKLLAGGARRRTLVETRRSGRKPVEKAQIRVIELVDEGMPTAVGEAYEWIFEQRRGNGWFEFERYSDGPTAKRAARKYKTDGAEVECGGGAHDHSRNYHPQAAPLRAPHTAGAIPMTQILNITRNDDGQYEITDQRGKVVEGPFETNAAAWKALDRLDREADIPKRRSNKKVLWGKPETKSKKTRRKEKRQQERADHKMKVNAAKAVGWVRSVAAAKFDPAGERAYRDQKLGTFGPASEVRHIDVAQYLAEKTQRGEL
ncbi:hypothetical protein [Ensifer canadensis]